MMEIKQVGIIGAGVTGLTTAKTFLEEGYQVTVFEKQKGLGGVWEKSRSYPELTTQTPGNIYSFSDYPMPQSYPLRPTAEHIRDYLKSYAQHFGVLDRIKYGANVINVEKRTDNQPGWEVNVRFQDENEGQITEVKYFFDFIVVCNGVFSTPKIPTLPGVEEFKANGGVVLHSTEFNDASMISGKRVAVVGFGNSSADIAAYAVDKAQECTLIFRKTKWKLPEYILGLFHVQYIVLSRFSQFVHGAKNPLSQIAKPLSWVFWRLVEICLRLQFRIDSCGMRPEQAIDKLVNCRLYIRLSSVDFYKHIRSGKLKTQKTEITRFVPGGVKLANGESLQADVVIFGTGFRKDIPFLSPEYRQKILDDRGLVLMYRNMIHPDIPRMGFNGYNGGIFGSLMSEVSARWLTEYLKGNLQVPSRQQMLQVIESTYDSIDPNKCTPQSMFKPIDQLMTDLGANPHRYGPNLIAEYLLPINPSGYHNLQQELLIKNHQREHK